MLFSVLTIVCSLTLFCAKGHAQQAIINLPSADVTPPGQLFVMNESFVRPFRRDNTLSSTHFLTYGLTPRTELAITQFGFRPFDVGQQQTVAIGLKTVQPIFKKWVRPHHELKLTAGYMVPISLLAPVSVGQYAYSHLSGRIPKLKTRLTAGVNFGTEQIFDRDTVNFIAGIEQPLFSPNLDLIAEYYAGTHSFGGLITGLVYRHTKWDMVFVAGYRIPNNRLSGREGFVFEIGKFFTLKKKSRNKLAKPSP